MLFIGGMIFGGIISSALMSICFGHRYEAMVSLYDGCVDKWEEVAKNLTKLAEDAPPATRDAMENIIQNAIEYTRNSIWKAMDD